ncbi:hypothetical protein F5884DRAFT_342268 [Xylogone sp. PMI_703]|nr:hypothetical protein F5884DRAFT_342268 [Xylogone sp. PMI_703]
MGTPKRAQYVCGACNVRKKACDKALPACGFCTARKLTCRYDFSSRKGQRQHNPGRNFVPLATLCSSNELDLEQPDQHMHLSASPLSQCSLYTPSQSLNESVNQRVQEMIRRINHSVDSVGDQYFRTFHYRYPIISSELFYQTASKYRGANAPPADFSILLLGMALVTISPTLSRSSSSTSPSREWFYSTTKSLFALTQAAACASLPLVQVAFLIAAYEYICGRPEAAYISIGTCSSLTQVLGLMKELYLPAEDQPGFNSDELLENQKTNIAWAIPILERIILIEVNQKALLPRTEYPDLLPPNFPLKQSRHLHYFPDRSNHDSPKSSHLLDPDIDRFGWQAQAVSLLDQVLHITRSASSCHTTGLLELTELDRKIQDFFVAVMNEDDGRHTSACSSVALCIRSLFCLHRHILNTLPIPQNEDDQRAKSLSQAALDTICEMLIDTVRCFSNREETVMRPICCYYNLHCTLQCLKERQIFANDESLSADIDCVVSAKEAYLSKWAL